MDDLWSDEPTRVVPREAKADLMRADPLRVLTHARHATPVPVRPADLTETREIPIPPELLSLTL